MFWQNIFNTSIVLIAFLVIIIVIYYIINARGMKRQKAHFAELHQSLAPGKKVQLSNGIFGTLKRVGEETVDVEVKSGAVMEVSRFAISEIVEK